MQSISVFVDRAKVDAILFSLSMKMFLKNLKPLWKHVFSNMILCFAFTSSLYKIKAKSQSTWLHKH